MRKQTEEERRRHTVGTQEPPEVVAVQVGYAWLNRPDVSESKDCVGVEIQVIQAERMVAVRNWRIEMFINDGWWTRSEQFRSKSEVSTGELSE